MKVLAKSSWKQSSVRSWKHHFERSQEDSDRDSDGTDLVWITANEFQTLVFLPFVDFKQLIGV